MHHLQTKLQPDKHLLQPYIRTRTHKHTHTYTHTLASYSHVTFIQSGLSGQIFLPYRPTKTYSHTASLSASTPSLLTFPPCAQKWTRRRGAWTSICCTRSKCSSSVVCRTPQSTFCRKRPSNSLLIYPFCSFKRETYNQECASISRACRK